MAEMQLWLHSKARNAFQVGCSSIPVEQAVEVMMCGFATAECK